ncbi:putative transcriptional regulator [Pseudomonas aeruginosa]|nr:putative transcriptional regulator [Pseudomonas aeruginosa]
MAHNDYLMPSLRRLLIDHARLGKIFYRHPTTDDMQRDLELACDSTTRSSMPSSGAIRMRRRTSSVRISSCRAGAWPSTGTGRSGGGAGLRGLASPAPRPAREAEAVTQGMVTGFQ